MTKARTGLPPRHGHPDGQVNRPFTVAELAEQTGHCTRSIRRWIAVYRIPCAGRVGRAKHYWLSDILIAERDSRLAQLSGLIHARHRRLS